MMKMFDSFDGRRAWIMVMSPTNIDKRNVFLLSFVFLSLSLSLFGNQTLVMRTVNEKRCHRGPRNVRLFFSLLLVVDVLRYFFCLFVSKGKFT